MYTIGLPIKKPTRTNCFRVVIEYMHGDADGYTKETGWVNRADAEHFDELKLLRTFVSSDYNNFVTYHMSRGRADRAKRAERLAQLTGLQLEFVTDRLEDLEVGNMSYQDSVAIGEGITVTYLDEVGVEREVRFD